MGALRAERGTIRSRMHGRDSREMCINEVESRTAFGCDVAEFLM
ncbi:MAG: hypothetical protein WCJ30_03350 [Deltaproteobacteria bacterium]